MSVREFFVAPGGNDAAPGTKEAPKRSIGNALQLLASSRSSCPQDEAGDWTVWLNRGTYVGREALVVGPSCAGGVNARTVISAIPGHAVRITGAQTTQARSLSWTRDRELRRRLPAGAAGKVRCIELPRDCDCEIAEIGFARAMSLPPPLLHVAGRRMTPARWPKVGDFEILASAPEEPAGDRRAGAFRITPGNAPKLRSRDNVRAEIVANRDWEWSLERLESIDTETGDIALGNVSRVIRNGRVRLVNAPEFLSSPGECVLQNGCFYFIAPDGVDDRLLELTIASYPLIFLHETSHIVLRDIELSGTRSSAIEGSRANSVVIERCNIHGIGRCAILLDGTNHSVKQCEITDIGTVAVRMWSGDSSSLASGHSVISDCRIRDWGFWKKVYEPAVSLNGVSNVVERNRIAHGPHMAIEIRGNDHRICENIITDVLRDFADMGAVYLDLGERPTERGTVIENNLFHDFGDAWPISSAVFADRATMGLRVRGNLFLRLKNADRGSCSAVYGNGASHLVVQENLFVGCSNALRIDFYLNDWGVCDLPVLLECWTEAARRLGSSASSHLERYPELRELLSEDRLTPDSISFGGNVVAYSADAVGSCGVEVRFGSPEKIAQPDNRFMAAPDRWQAYEVQPDVSAALAIAGMRGLIGLPPLR